jgi:hypothetical protein
MRPEDLLCASQGTCEPSDLASVHARSISTLRAMSDLRSLVGTLNFEVQELREALYALSRRVPHPDDVFGPRVHPAKPYWEWE